MKKYLIYILLLILIQTGCKNELNQRIEGNWLGFKQAYDFDHDTIVDFYHIVLSIDQDSIAFRNFKYDYYLLQDSITKFSYLVIDSILIINQNSKSPDTLKLHFEDDNTLILSTPKSKFTHSRLLENTEELHLNDLVGNTYTIIDTAQIIDTIEFRDNSSVMLYNKKLHHPNQISKWILRHFHGNNILIIYDNQIPVLLINRINENDFQLRREPKDELTFQLNKIELLNKYSRRDLIGHWTGKSSMPDSEVTFIFDFDSVQMNEFSGGETVTATYSLNLSGTKMYCFHKYSSGPIFYEIVNIKTDSIFLKRLSPLKDSFVLTRVK